MMFAFILLITDDCCFIRKSNANDKEYDLLYDKELYRLLFLILNLPVISMNLIELSS